MVPITVAAQANATSRALWGCLLEFSPERMPEVSSETSVLGHEETPGSGPASLPSGLSTMTIWGSSFHDRGTPISSVEQPLGSSAFPTETLTADSWGRVG